VTIGSDLAATADANAGCPAEPCTSAHQLLPPTNTAEGGLLAPSDGVVVKWRIKVGDAAGPVGPVALRITRPGDSDTRTGAGTGVARAPAANQVSVFDERLPIQAGDAIGIDHMNATAFAGTAGAASAVWWDPPLPDGETPRTALPADLELLVNARIEPDADLDGFGDESQDRCPTDGSTQGPCDPDPPPPDPPPEPGEPSLRLFVGKHPQIDKRLKVRAVGFADSSLKLRVYVDPRGGACAAGPSAQPRRAERIISRTVSGEFRVEKRHKMKSRGRHTFCGYLGAAAGGSGPTSDSKSRLVRRPRLKVQTAQRTVSRALRRHEFAGRVVRNLEQRCRRRNRATFSCRFSSSFPGYRLTGRGSVRLGKRLSYRFQITVRGQRIALTDKNEGRFPG
jgi:hypothetical protein